jgi:hypothetical protein
MPRLLVTVVALAMGCAATDRLPDRVLEAMRATAPEGQVHIDVDSEGRVVRVTSEVPLAEVPQAVKDSAEREHPAGRTVGCERVWDGDSDSFLLVRVSQALRHVAHVDAAGRLLGTENEISPAAAPQIILDAANQSMPGGSIESVMEVRTGDRLEYRIRKRIADRTIAIRVGSGGDVRETVREIPASLRSPAPPALPGAPSPRS